MLAIKLSKVGKINKKMFRLIISEKGRDPFGDALEILGSYNPYTKELQVKKDRINYWVSKGAQMTASVNNLLVGKDIVTGEKVVASKAGKKSEKRLSQIKAKDDKKSTKEASAAVAAEATEAPVTTAEAVSETPAVE